MAVFEPYPWELSHGNPQRRDRDFDTTPYDRQERRVCDYLQSLMKGIVGCGDDPIGFLIASHMAVVRELYGNDDDTPPQGRESA